MLDYIFREDDDSELKTRFLQSSWRKNLYLEALGQENLVANTLLTYTRSTIIQLFIQRLQMNPKCPVR